MQTPQDDIAGPLMSDVNGAAEQARSAAAQLLLAAVVIAVLYFTFVKRPRR